MKELYDMMYCVRCRDNTETIGLEVVRTKNNRTAQSGTCSVCGTRKFKFVKGVSGGDLVTGLNSFTKGIRLPGERYAGEIHLPGMNFMGPCTRLDLRLNPNGTPKPDSMPIDRVDEAAYRHDMAYDHFKDTATRNKADSIMIQELDAITSPTVRERVERAIAKPALAAKVRFGLGLKKKSGRRY